MDKTNQNGSIGSVVHVTINGYYQQRVGWFTFIVMVLVTNVFKISTIFFTSHDDDSDSDCPTNTAATPPALDRDTGVGGPLVGCFV
jgi:hypothetical protein